MFSVKEHLDMSCILIRCSLAKLKKKRSWKIENGMENCETISKWYVIQHYSYCLYKKVFIECCSYRVNFLKNKFLHNIHMNDYKKKKLLVTSWLSLSLQCLDRQWNQFSHIVFSCRQELQIFTRFCQSSQELQSLNKGHSQDKIYFSLATRKIPHNDNLRVDHQLCKSGCLESRCQLTLHESVVVLK